MYKRSIFWFRQDLRTSDNTWLIECLKQSGEILPIFLLDENLIGKFWWLDDAKFGFIREAIEEIWKNLKKIWGKDIETFVWTPEQIIPKLVTKYQINAIFCNRSYGSYGAKRDAVIQEKISTFWAHFHSFWDFLLVEPREIEQRKVFTPYYKLWQKKVQEKNPQIQNYAWNISQFFTREWKHIWEYISLEKHPFFTIDFWKSRLEKYIRSDYDEFRNDLDKDGTSKLSPYLRFGIFSIREIYHTARNIWKSVSWETGLGSFISEMAWREFWWHIFHYFPDTKTQEFQEKRRHISWSQNKELFEKWCNGETGYPIIDAAMRQLNTTNWMHGRARMIVASFLTKDMHIDWRLGEDYFKEKLLDYDEAVNLWNWQWSTSVWADPKPLRIFNPILQSEKFDPEAKFIKKYIPELEWENVKAIHNPLENNLWYIAPIVDHRVETTKARELYKS